jgi:hypothetical protein
MPNFSTQHQLTVRGVGAVDYREVFEYSREEEVGTLVDAWLQGMEKFHAEARKVLHAPNVTPPSGVRGPFAALLVLPGSILTQDAVTTGAAANASETALNANVVTAKLYIEEVQARVAQLNEHFPGSPTTAHWSVLVDCQGGHTTAGFDAAVREAVGLQAAHVCVADLGSSYGVVGALASVVDTVAEASNAPDFIALRAGEDLEKLPSSKQE